MLASGVILLTLGILGIAYIIRYSMKDDKYDLGVRVYMMIIGLIAIGIECLILYFKSR